MEDERRVTTWDNSLIGRFTVDPAAELRVAPDGTLEGYAVVYDALSLDLGGFVERFAPASVELAGDVLATFNHSVGSILGRSSSGTLALELNETGLRYRVKLPDTGAGRDVRELVRRGDVRGSSLTFDMLEEKWGKVGEEALRTLTRVKVKELGPVTLPAYPDTTAAVRSLTANWGGSSRGDQVRAANMRRARLRYLELEIRRGE